MIELPFVPVAGGSEGAMIAELKSAVAAEQPIIMMFWQPHWIHAEITFDWVDGIRPMASAWRNRARQGDPPAVSSRRRLTRL